MEIYRSFWSVGSHLPDLFVTLSWSIEVRNCESVFTWGKGFQVDGSTVALTLWWWSSHLSRSFVNLEAIFLWSILSIATFNEKSFLVLDAFDNDILLCWVFERNKRTYFLGTLKRFWESLIFRYFPVVSVVSIVSYGEMRSPLVKRNPEFSIIWSVGDTSLSSPLISPVTTIDRPWSVISAITPWVSHLNESVDTLSVCSETETLENSISVTRNKVVFTFLTSSSHWVLFLGSIYNNLPEFIISHFIWLMFRYWHTSKSCESFKWSTSVELSVVDVQLSESFLKKD